MNIEPLGPQHDRQAFSCGHAQLDQYLCNQASQDVKRRVANCFVAADNAGRIAGYYSFAAASVPLTDLLPTDAKRLPRYPSVPAGLIGRLAIGQAFQRQGLGGALIIDAALRAARMDAAIHALIVEAKDDTASAFYRHLGFTAFASRPRALYLPLATALRASVVEP